MHSAPSTGKPHSHGQLSPRETLSYNVINCGSSSVLPILDFSPHQGQNSPSISHFVETLLFRIILMTCSWTSALVGDVPGLPLSRTSLGHLQSGLVTRQLASLGGVS